MGREDACRVTLVAALLPTLETGARPVSVDELAGTAGLDREEVAEQLAALETRGVPIVRGDARGYRLEKDLDDLLIPEAVIPLLLQRSDPSTASTLGIPYHYSARCGSTNQALKNEAMGLPCGAVAATDDQTEGRGRLGRAWSSEPGKDITFSVLLLPSELTRETTLLSLTTGLAVAEVIERLPGLRGRVQVKWPNDVLIDGRKVCGILLESSVRGNDLQWIVAGIGLNVNGDPIARLQDLGPAEQDVWRGRPLPTSLKAESGKEVGRGRLLVELIAGLSRRWFDTDVAESLAELRSRDALLGRQVQVFAGPPDEGLVAAGEAVGLDSRGRLLVRGHDGRTAPVSTGEATLSVDSPAT